MTRRTRLGTPASPPARSEPKPTRTSALPDRPALTPKRRFPEFRDGTDWAEKLIGDFLEESRVRGSSGDVARKLTVKLWGKGVFEKIESLSGSENTQYYRRKAGQFIYSKLDFLNQAFGVIPTSLDGLESTVDLPCFDISSELHPNFLLEYVKRPSFYEKFGEIADGGRKAKRIQAESFLSFPIRVPRRFLEQQKIAECLSTLDELIGAESQKLDALKAHKKGLMQQLFPREGETLPRLRFPEFHSAPEWEENPFDEFVAKSFYGTSSSTAPQGQYPVLRMGNMADGRLDFTTLVYIDLDRESFESFRLEDGDILLNRTNSPALVGKISLFRLKSECLTASYIVTYRLKKQRLDPSFCNFMLNTPLYQAKIKSLAKPSISQANINPTTFRKELVVSVPAFPEQLRIATCLSSLDDLIAAQSDRLAALQTHKQGLLQQLFPSPEAATT
ncbi:MAG: restriction endonuclease subunit S [Opitutae bacterium]|nr:restriction endonuclease subunit S [Opitutae bacterium]